MKPKEVNFGQDKGREKGRRYHEEIEIVVKIRNRLN